MSNARKYTELFDYLSAPVAPQEAHGVLAFGRKDLLIARKVVDLSHAGFANYVVFSGSNKGKDSGDLRELGITEAQYLESGARDIAAKRGITVPRMFTENEAETGGENVRNSLDLMDREHLPYVSGLIAVAHATSSRRLAAMLDMESEKRGTPVDPIYSVPTDYPYDPENPTDQQEAIDEMMRFVTWPDKGWLKPQADLPQNLVDFSVDQKKQQ